MEKRTPRSDQNKLKFPKVKRTKIGKKKKSGTPEKIIQGQVNGYLEAVGINFLRFPDTLFRAIFANPRIPPHIKRLIKTEIAGWPDNMLYIPVSDKFCLACAVECKSDVGKLRGMQKTRSKEIPFNIIRDFDNFKVLVSEFERAAEKIKNYLEGVG